MHGMALLSLNRSLHFNFPYAPMHDVAPSAVSTAEIIEARICSDHLSVSFLVIRFSFFYFGTDFTDFHGFFPLIQPCLKIND